MAGKVYLCKKWKKWEGKAKYDSHVQDQGHWTNEESETLSDLARSTEIAPKQITEWRKEFMEKSGIVFEYKETESKEIKGVAERA